MAIILRGIAVFACLSLSVMQAHAAPITLFNTGVNNDGSLAAEGSVDLHYTLILSADTDADQNGPEAFVVQSPRPAQYVNTATAQYIAPDPNQNFAECCAPGNYTYRTTFDLTGLDPSTATISGIWRTDDAGLDIFINGTSTGQTSVVHTDTAFSVNSGFVAGLNTLDFAINNAAGPSGLRISLTGTADVAGTPPVPEPGSLVLLALGFGGVARALWTRRRERPGV